MRRVYYTYWQDDTGSIRKHFKQWHRTKADADKHLKELRIMFRYSGIDNLFKSEFADRHILCGNMYTVVNPDFSID